MPVPTHPDLDQFVDYTAEYSAVVDKAKITGERMNGLCPFHDDHNSSFSVDLKTGQYKCFACNEQGNFITFWSKRNGVDQKTAYRQICEKYHVDQTPDTYTVNDYATAKHLPLEYLLNVCCMEAGRDKGGPFLKLPYFDENLNPTRPRKRYAPGIQPRFMWCGGKTDTFSLYGAWNLKQIREAGWVILVEGESDTQTLDYLGFPVLGIPGATNFHEKDVSLLSGISRIFIHVEPDDGGEKFRADASAKLRKGGYTGEIVTFSCGLTGCKDPSELFIRNGQGAADTLRDLISTAQPLEEPPKIGDSPPETVPEEHKALELPPGDDGKPLDLTIPRGYFIFENGVYRKQDYVDYHLVIRTPILLTRRFSSLETNEERVELTFWRDGQWHSGIYNRADVFSAKSIIEAAKYGAMVTSENAKPVVRWLDKLETANMDTIPLRRSTSSFGWKTKHHFIPGNAGDIVLDMDEASSGIAAAYHPSGELSDWVELMRPHRERSVFRFILAAGFAAPLLKILLCRTFIVYAWESSKGGKTAALKSALSIWGDPIGLMSTFHATRTGLERRAALYNDLPMGIDELETAREHQGFVIENLYMLTSGVGKLRANKNGGLQSQQSWRSIIISTGEHPIYDDNTMTGINSRLVELNAAPIPVESEGAELHQKLEGLYGTAGVEFIRHVIDCGDDAIKKAFVDFFAEANACVSNGAHVSHIAAVATADYFASQWIFGEMEPMARYQALQMIQDIARLNSENAVRDVNENAQMFVADWIASNRKSFTDDSRERYGFCDVGIVYVFPTVLKRALTDAGYNPRKTLKYFAEKHIIECDSRGNPSVTKWFLDSATRFVKINVDLLNKSGEFDEFTKTESLPF